MSAAIITGIFTLLGGAGGAMLTYWQAKRLADEARTESRRDAQRQVVLDLVAAGRAKVEAYRTLLPVFTKLKDRSTSEWIEFANSETTERIGQTNKELSRALIHSALLAGDERLVSAIDRVRERDRTFSEEVVGAAMEGDMRKGFAGLTELAKALYAVEDAARDLLRVPVATQKKPRASGRRV